MVYVYIICTQKHTVVRSAVHVHGGSPIGFSGSGTWRIWRPGFGILVKRENDIRDCNHERDARFGNFTWRDSRSCSLKNRDLGGPVMKIQNKTQLLAVGRSLSSSRSVGHVENSHCGGYLL